MIFGLKSDFAIEAYCDWIDDDKKYVFGRMCCWSNGKPLGDIDEADCMLDVTAVFFESLLKRLDQLENSVLNELSDSQLYKFIDCKIYEDDERSIDQVISDAETYYKYDFLTNGGESFDCSKSFILVDGNFCRILFNDDRSKENVFTRVSKTGFISAVSDFLLWYEAAKSK